MVYESGDIHKIETILGRNFNLVLFAECDGKSFCDE